MMLSRLLQSIKELACRSVILFMPNLYSVMALNSSLEFLSNPQAENLADFYEFCKDLELDTTFQFLTLRQVGSSSSFCTSLHLGLEQWKGE